MMIAPPWLFFGGLAALLALMAVVSRSRERKRRAAYEEYSLMRGFTFEPERPDGEHPFREAFEPFNQGHSRSWGYTISGTKNQSPFTAFEYKWTTGGGKSSHRHVLSGM